MNESRKKIGLALSGGGALGIAHIGVLKQLEKNNITPDLICGTSAGAIIGLLYAIGGTEKIESFVAYLDGAGVFTKKFIFPGGLFKTVRTALEKYLGVTNFNETKIPFTCTATNIQTGELVVLKEGNVVDAVMASAAYPGVFSTQTINDMSLVDGGVIKVFPASIVKDQGADFVIGSSLHNLKNFEPSGVFGFSQLTTMSRAIDIMQLKIAEIDLAQCDFCFTPEVNGFHWYQFDQMELIASIGEKHASQKIGLLIDKLKNSKINIPNNF